MHPTRFRFLSGSAPRVALACLLAALAPPLVAHEPTVHRHDHAKESAPAPGAAYASLAPFECADTSLACATAATPAWAPDGSVWVAWIAGGTVSVARSSDAGRTFSAPVVIGRHGQWADVGPDARPQILIGADERIVVVYDVFKDDAWNARVLAASSSDGGETFSAPRPVTDDPASQRFPAITALSDGSLFVAWIDKRVIAGAATRGRKSPGASLAYAWSNDGGKTFSDARIGYPRSCECCRIGVALAAAQGADLPRQQPVVLFRAIFEPNVRDHAVLSFHDRESPGPLRRVADDHWAIDACPHHGPALAIAGDGSYHAAWFTQGRARSGVFYAYSRDAGMTFSAPMRVGHIGRPASRPHLLAAGSRLWLAWKEFDGERTTVHVRTSIDSGGTWSPARQVAQTDGYSDHPLLTARAEQVYLSWQTQAEGYRLLALERQR